MDKGELGAAAYGAGLEELVFAIKEIVGAAAHAADPLRKQSVGRAADVFAGIELEGAATYKIDVELEQVVFDGTAGAVTFGAILDVIFSITELVGAAA